MSSNTNAIYIFISITVFIISLLFCFVWQLYYWRLLIIYHKLYFSNFIHTYILWTYKFILNCPHLFQKSYLCTQFFFSFFQLQFKPEQYIFVQRFFSRENFENYLRPMWTFESAIKIWIHKISILIDYIRFVQDFSV